MKTILGLQEEVLGRIYRTRTLTILKKYEELLRAFANFVYLFKELSEGTIVGLDNLNDYYDPTLKDYRLSEIEKAKPAGIEYEFVKGDLADKALIDGLFEKYHFDVVVNLAAQAGVRYSITNPDAYIQSNMIGFYNILEACRHSLTPGPSPEGKGEASPQPSPEGKGIIGACNTWYMHRHRVFMEVTRRYHSVLMTGWIILSRCMQLRRRAMSCLPIVIRSCIISLPRACDSLRSMALPVVLIWRISASPTNC